MPVTLSDEWIEAYKAKLRLFTSLEGDCAHGEAQKAIVNSILEMLDSDESLE